MNRVTRVLILFLLYLEIAKPKQLDCLLTCDTVGDSLNCTANRTLEKYNFNAYFGSIDMLREDIKSGHPRTWGDIER